MNPPPVLMWFRRDLRLNDNLALQAAFQTGAPILPIFIFDPTILKSASSGAPRVAFLLRGLAALAASLREYGGDLLIRQGDPRTVLPALVVETGASQLFYNRDYSPFALKRDREVEAALAIPITGFDDAVLQAPGAVMKADGTPFTVFTPFKRHLLTLPQRPIVEGYLAEGQFHRLEGVANPGLPTLESLGFRSTIETPLAGEAYGAQRLSAFMQNAVYHYGQRRNLLAVDPNYPDEPGASCLSPYFRLGMLSPRQAYWAARQAHSEATSRQAKDSVETWVSEIIWREFYMHILYHFPHVMSSNFQRKYDNLQWRHAPAELQAWKDGLTGYPVVDAAMRQLRHTGWLSNRARMVVASFLTKDLLIDWREGERHFMQWLVDGDPAANNGGWQWTAGTGTDAQPYFRVFNPVAQSRKFDPNGVFIRRWLPELAGVPDRYLHAPWEMDSPLRNYPPPIVEHHLARERALAAYKAVG